MKQTTKRFLSMIASLVLMVAALIVFFDFIEPEYAAAQKVKSEGLTKQAFVAQEQQTVQKVQQLITNYQGQSETQQLVSLALPTAPDVSGALAQLAGIVQNQTLGAKSYSISLGSTAAGSGGAPSTEASSTLTRPIGTVTLQVSFTGSYENLKSFFEELQNNIRIFDVQAVAITPLGKPNQDTYQVALTVATYYQAPAPAAAGSLQ